MMQHIPFQTRSSTRTRRIVGLLAGPALGLLAFDALAAQLHFEYLAARQDGSTVSGTFGYEDSVPDAAPAGDVGRYVGAGYLTGTVVGGAQDGVTFAATGLDVLTLDNASVGGAGEARWADLFNLGESGPAYNYIAFVSELVDALGPPAVPPLDSDQLANPDLAAALTTLGGWNLERYVSVCPAPCRANVQYDLVSVRRVIPPVPEPAPLPLVAAALVGLAVVAARRKATAQQRG